MTSVGEKNGLPYTACIKFRFKELEKSIARPFLNLYNPTLSTKHQSSHTLVIAK